MSKSISFTPISDQLRLKWEGDLTQQKSWVFYWQAQLVPCLDWDWADPLHSSKNVSIVNLGDAIQRLQDLHTVSPVRFRVYITPGGVHAICISHRIPPKEFFPHVKEALRPDQLYVQYACDIDWYSLRVSPKQRRKNDFIAYYIGDVGNGKVNPLSCKEVKLHDDMILQYRNLYHQTVDEEFIRYQLSTVSRD